MKKAFTLSEALVTLAIIGVLAAILIPVVDKAKPDKDKVTYKKALYTMQNAMSNAMDELDTKGVKTGPGTYTTVTNSAAYWADTAVRPVDFCTYIAESLNLAGNYDCTNTSSYDSPNFTTTDGLKYWGLENNAFNALVDDTTGEIVKCNPTNKECYKKYYHTIYVDRQMTDGERKKFKKLRTTWDGNDSKNPDAGIKIRVKYDGRISTDGSTDYSYENELIEKSFQTN